MDPVASDGFDGKHGFPVKLTPLHFGLLAAVLLTGCAASKPSLKNEMADKHPAETTYLPNAEAA